MSAWCVIPVSAYLSPCNIRGIDGLEMKAPSTLNLITGGFN